MWKYGITYASQNPVLGNGYSAFWMEGRPAAEALWEEFFIPTKIGFHFHNVFIQTWVDMGLIGVVIITTMILIYCYKSTKAIIQNGDNSVSILLLGLSFMFLIRAFVEVDILNAFGIGPLLFFSMFPRLFAKEKLETVQDVTN